MCVALTSFAAEVLMIHLQCPTYHMVNCLWEKAYKLAKLLAQCKWFINWYLVPLVMIWISGTPPLFTTSRHADTQVSWETHGWKSAIDGYFHSVIAWIILIVKTSSHYRTQLLVYILRKHYMFLVKYSVMRLHTDLNCRYKCNLYYYITICVFVSCGSHITEFVLQ